MNKTDKIRGLLLEGYSTDEVLKKIATSRSYVYKIKSYLYRGEGNRRPDLRNWRRKNTDRRNYFRRKNYQDGNPKDLSNSGNAWTSWEDALVMNRTSGDRVIAFALKRTVQAVQKRRNLLKREKL